MKLWQKIFLWTLFIAMLAVSSTGISILKNNYETSLDMQISSSLSEHEYMLSNMKNRIITERTKQGVVLLNQDILFNIIGDIFNVNDNKQSTAIAIYDRDSNILYRNTVNPMDKELYNTVLNNNDTFKKITLKNGIHTLYIGSVTELENQTYVFVTATDISNIYEMYNRQLNYTKMLSTTLSLLCAFTLLVIVKSLLRPLNILNSMAHSIAGGDYSKRIPVRKKNEISELATNMNLMAESIEDKICQIEETSDNRRQFINNLTHEMKTPLTSILGFADIIRIKGNITTEELAEYSGIIFEEAKRLKSLSGKMMELITVGETNLDFNQMSTELLFSQISLTLKPVTSSNNIFFKYECDDCLITIDCELFKSMIFNIIDNAIKASKSGSDISLTGQFNETSEKKKFIISVIDHGIGIPPKDLAKITEPFYMVDKARSRKAGGAGIGLALCKKIADIHNAEFRIESTLGQGTTITIELEAVKNDK